MALNNTETLETKNQECRNGTQRMAAWGRLCGENIKKPFKSLDLNKEEFSAGRAMENDLVLTTNELPEHILIHISKVHFLIKRANCDLESPAYIQDVSLNGTFVNSEKIDRNKRHILNDGDTISLSLPTNNTFVFLDLRLPPELANTYYVERHLGRGGFGLVNLVKNFHTGQQFAMKIVKKKNVSRTRRSRDPQIEVEILKNLSHPGIVRMHGVVNRPKAVYMLLDIMSGGDLLTRITSKSYLSEDISKLYFYQLCHAIKYIHNRSIIHRDLKLENILLKTSDEQTLLKVCDFGLSKFVQEETLEDGTSTGGQHVSTKVDIWSLGVVLFCCLSGTWPFDPSYGSPLADQIVKGEFTYVATPWKDVSNGAKLLVNEILTVDPEKRPSIDDILQCSWFWDASMQQTAKKLTKLESMEGEQSMLRISRPWSV